MDGTSITLSKMDEILSQYGTVQYDDDGNITGVLPNDFSEAIGIEEIYSGGVSSTEGGEYSASKGVNTPKINSAKMVPIKWNGSNWVKTTADDSDWYSYTTTAKKWANVVIGGIFDDNGILDESKTGYSMFVWIPRFAYQIADNYHSGGEGVSGTINIKFLKGTTSQDGNGNTYSTTYDTSEVTTGGGMSDYVVHPAFQYSSAVAGIWVAKFEASRSDATSSSAGSSSTIAVQAGVMSWRSISVNDIYTNCLNYNSTLGSHMMKNSEWGAVAYLTQSAYGKNSEVYINNSSSYITGSCGATVSASSSDTCENDYTVGVAASTTGNIYGIYDMSGGAYEYVAAYVDNTYTQDGGSRNTTTYGASLIAGEDYTKDVYEASDSDTYSTNYTTNASIFGDAVYETSSSGSGTGSWYYDFSNFPYTSNPFFKRGGYYSLTTYDGVFSFNYGTGGANSSYSFRPVLVVL